MQHNFKRLTILMSRKCAITSFSSHPDLGKGNRKTSMHSSTLKMVSNTSSPTCSDNTVHISSSVNVIVEVWSGGLQFLIKAGHHSDVVDLIWLPVQQFGQIILNHTAQ